MIKGNLDAFIEEIAFRSSKFKDDFFFNLDYKLLANLPDKGKRYSLRGTLSSCMSEFREVLVFDSEDEFQKDKAEKFGCIQRILKDRYEIESALEDNKLKVFSLNQAVKKKLLKKSIREEAI